MARRRRAVPPQPSRRVNITPAPKNPRLRLSGKGTRLGVLLNTVIGGGGPSGLSLPHIETWDDWNFVDMGAELPVVFSKDFDIATGIEAGVWETGGIGSLVVASDVAGQNIFGEGLKLPASTTGFIHTKDGQVDLQDVMIKIQAYSVNSNFNMQIQPAVRTDPADGDGYWGSSIRVAAEYALRIYRRDIGVNTLLVGSKNFPGIDSQTLTDFYMIVYDDRIILISHNPVNDRIRTCVAMDSTYDGTTPNNEIGIGNIISDVREGWGDNIRVTAAPSGATPRGIWNGLRASLGFNNIDDSLLQNVFGDMTPVLPHKDNITPVFDTIKSSELSKLDMKTTLPFYPDGGASGPISMFQRVQDDSEDPDFYGAGTYSNVSIGWQIFKRVASVNTRLAGVFNLAYELADIKRKIEFIVKNTSPTDLSVEFFNEVDVSLDTVHAITDSDAALQSEGSIGVGVVGFAEGNTVSGSGPSILIVLGDLIIEDAP